MGDKWKKQWNVFFNKQIVGTAAERFELELHSLQKLGSFENYIYEGSKNGEAYILRLVHSSHRSKEQIASELDWLNYLRTCGANVCGAFLSENSSFIESIPAEETFFHASLFEKAKGSAVSMDDPAFNPTLFEAWGRTIGQFHQLTKNYKRPAHIEPRPDLVQSFEQQLLPFVPMNDKALYHNVKHLFEQVQKIPKTANRYQLIHSDLHRGNFHYDNGNIYAFDFDDCSHHHIVHDLAMPLYYSVWLKYDSIEQRNEFAAHFFAAVSAWISERA